MIQFQCKFFAPALLTEDQNFSDICKELYQDLAIPIMLFDEHEIINSMQKQFPRTKFKLMFVAIGYDKPYEA
jgi:hypothetical protein